MEGAGHISDDALEAFGAAELIQEKHLKESDVKGLSGERLIELVAAVKKQRDAAIAESKRLAAEAEA